jgi:hypothetical protein
MIGSMEIVLIIAISLVATVVPLGLVGFFVFRLLKGSAERQKLLQTGVAGTAQVLSVQQTGTYINNQPEVMVALMVSRAGMAPYQVNTTMILSLLDVPRLQPGASVAVKIDAADPQKVAVDLSQAAALPGMMPQAAMNFGAQPPGYGAPPAGYGAPPQGYGAPPAGAPPAGFGAGADALAGSFPCRACGKPVAQGHAFCPHCGARTA